MATGYTYAVKDGKITEFRAFALQCARAFGALIEMRDDPLDVPIPNEFEAGNYYRDALAGAKAKLAEIEAMDDRAVARAAEEAYQASHTFWIERQRQTAIERARYEAMIAKVEAWTPPTPDHDGLKKFMLDQLRESVEWDCRGFGGSGPAPTRQTEAEWKAEALAQARHQIEHYTAEHAKEIERVNGRNEWIRDLRASL